MSNLTKLTLALGVGLWPHTFIGLPRMGKTALILPPMHGRSQALARFRVPRILSDLELETLAADWKHDRMHAHTIRLMSSPSLSANPAPSSHNILRTHAPIKVLACELQERALVRASHVHDRSPDCIRGRRSRQVRSTRPRHLIRSIVRNNGAAYAQHGMPSIPRQAATLGHALGGAVAEARKPDRYVRGLALVALRKLTTGHFTPAEDMPAARGLMRAMPMQHQRLAVASGTAPDLDLLGRPWSTSWDLRNRVPGAADLGDFTAV